MPTVHEDPAPSSSFSLDASVPTAIDFINTVPAPLTIALVNLGPIVSVIRHVAEIVSWKTSSWYDSWLAIAGWWAVCLLWAPVVRFLLPLVLVLVVFSTKRLPVKRRTPPLVTEQSLQTAVNDLRIIHSLIPSLPTIPETWATTTFMFRFCLIIYLPYLILTFRTTLPTIFGIAGTFLFICRAPWFYTLCKILWSSAYIRLTIYKIYSFVSGTPLSEIVATSSFTLTAPISSPRAPFRFLFTVYENQRWWVGLDWTAALLPSERPSWCSAPPALQPVSPPAAYTLPADTVVVMEDGHGQKVRRTARWTWEENVWKVLVKHEDAGTTRVERPLPKEKEPDSGMGSSISKVVAKAKHRTSFSMGTVEDLKPLEKEHAKEENAENEAAGDDPITDVDGWVYGDNKWERHSNRAGIGKYTRYRCWTRVAILHEVVEVLSPSSPRATSQHLQEGAESLPNSPLAAMPTPASDSDVKNESTHTQDDREEDTKDQGGRRAEIRKRLKTALRVGPS